MQGLSQNHFEELLHHTEENILMGVVMTLIMMGDHIEIKGNLNKEGTKVRVGGHWIEKTIRIEDILEEDMQIKVEDPLIMEDLLMMEDPLMMGDPLMMKDH